MAQKKTAKKRTRRTPTRDMMGQTVSLIARLLQGSRDINQADKGELARLAKALKD